MLSSYISQLEQKGELHLRVKVWPLSSESAFWKIDKNNINNVDVETLCFKLKSAAQDNKANKELLTLLAKLFNVSGSSISIISGASSRIKLIKICK